MLAYLGTAETFLGFAPGDPDAGVTIPPPPYTHLHSGQFLVQWCKSKNFSIFKIFLKVVEK
jgi:hypothetical protein